VFLAILFRAAVAVALIFVLVLLAPGRWIGLALFAPTYGVALGLGQTFDFHLLVLAALAALAAMERRSLAGLLAIGVLSAPLWLTKFSLGLGVAAVVATFALAWRLALQGSVRGAVAIGSAHVVSLLGVACLLLGSPAAFVRWLRMSLEL